MWLAASRPVASVGVLDHRAGVGARNQDLLAQIDRATHTSELGARLMGSLPQLVRASVAGFLLFCRERKLTLLDCRGRDDRFTRRYRERGLPYDDVLRAIIASGEPVHDGMLYREADWREHRFYTGFARDENLLQYGGSPILAGGFVRGAIVCARSEGAPALDSGELLALATVALHVQHRLAQLEAHVPKSAFERLTRRQVEVCEHVARGQSNRETAERLKVGTDVIKWHLKQIFNTVGVESREELSAQFLFWYPDACDLQSSADE
jgi:LuxR family maltose regulon positive regulatory protein